jgi:hypothetical protein
MKTNRIIIWIIISIVLTSCFSKNYRIFTRVERNGSCIGEFHEIKDTVDTGFLSHFHSSGWKISQTDTVISDRNKKSVMLGKKFKSVEELSADTSRQWYRLIPEEALKKRFRWFYTYYSFTAVYPEVTVKGRVPIEKYLNRDEQNFYLRGDMSAYRGLNGIYLKEKFDDIEEQFIKWYNQTVYEENIDIILQFADDFHSKFFDVKDSLYSINKSQIKIEYMSPPMMDDVCKWLDSFFDTDYFSKLYYENAGKMDGMFDERMKAADELLNYDIQYELTLPGTIITTNADTHNDGLLAWKINMLKFLADDYTLTAESRAANVWAFAVTLLLIAFSVYCLGTRRK